MIPESANVVFPTEALSTLQVVASQPTNKDGPTFTLSTDQQGRKVLGRIDIRDQKIGTQGEKKTRRGRGKRKGKSIPGPRGTARKTSLLPQTNRIRYPAGAVRVGLGMGMLISVLNPLPGVAEQRIM